MYETSLENGLIMNARVVIDALHKHFVEVHPLNHNGTLEYLLPCIHFSFIPPSASTQQSSLQPAN